MNQKKKFPELTFEERKEKLLKVLQVKTEYWLTEEIIHKFIDKIDLDKQYHIHIFNNEDYKIQMFKENFAGIAKCKCIFGDIRFNQQDNKVLFDTTQFQVYLYCYQSETMHLNKYETNRILIYIPVK